MKIPSLDPCFDSVSSSGKASKRIEDDYKSAQLADLGELERANQSVDSWRRVASVEAIAIVGMIGLCAMLGSRPLQPPVVYHESENGLVLHRMETLTSLTASNIDIAAQIARYVTADREVDGLAFGKEQANVDLVSAMTKDVRPYNAHAKAVEYFLAPEHNPQQLGMNGMVRTVSHVVPHLSIGSTPQIQEWITTWHEEVTTMPGQPSTPSEHLATIVIKPNPQIQNNPDNPEAALMNPVGVEVIQSDIN